VIAQRANICKIRKQRSAAGPESERFSDLHPVNSSVISAIPPSFAYDELCRRQVVDRPFFRSVHA
jgi:hypothetical protein